MEAKRGDSAGIFSSQAAETLGIQPTLQELAHTHDKK
jgi:hypothetical protein